MAMLNNQMLIQLVFQGFHQDLVHKKGQAVRQGQAGVRDGLLRNLLMVEWTKGL